MSCYINSLSRKKKSILRLFSIYQATLFLHPRVIDEMGKLRICLEDTLSVIIVIISGRIRPTVRVRVSSRDYSAGNNRDTPFRAELINQIQAGRKTFP